MRPFAGQSPKFTTREFSLSDDRMDFAMPVEHGMTKALLTYLQAERGRQSSLAEKIGVSRSYLSDVANGKKPGSVSLFRAIADATGLPMAELMGETIQGSFQEPAPPTFNAPSKPGAKTASLIRQLYPALANPGVLSAPYDLLAFGIRAGDTLVIEAKSRNEEARNGDLVLARKVSSTDPPTVVGSVAKPWIIGKDCQISGHLGEDTAIVGVICGVIRGAITI